MTTFYIDPTVTAGGTGTELDPFKLWSEVTWTAGNTYLQKRNTTALETITLDVTGTENGHITLGAYGTGINPIVDGELTRDDGINIETASYVDISDFRITRSLVKGLNIYGDFFGSPDYVTVTDCIADNIPSSSSIIGNGVGFAVDNIAHTSLSSHYITFLRCEAHTCGRIGFDTQTAGTNIKWIDCIAHNNGAAYPGGGFYAHPYRVSVTSGWTLVSGDIYTRTKISQNDIVKIVFHENITTFLVETTSPTPSAGEFYYLPGTSGELRVNLGVGINPNTQTIHYARGPQSDFTWLRCKAYNNKCETTGTTHGVGIEPDDLISDSIVDQCEAYNNEGAGIFFFKGQRNTIRSCIAYRNSSLYNEQIMMNQQEDGQIINCVSRDGYSHGIAIGTGNVTVSNCISLDNSNYGLIVTSGTADTYNNCLYGNSSGSTFNNGGTLNQTNNITSDPLLDSMHYPHTDSPCIGAGAWTGQFLKDHGNRPFKKSNPSMGAWEHSSRDEARTRTVR